MGFFAIMNPVANTPVFVSLTKNIDTERKKKGVAIKAVLYAFVIVALFCFFGHLIFKLFGITLPAFQIAGGILLFLVGMNMLNGKESSIQYPSTDKHKEAIKKQVDDGSGGVAISPLALPILAGPGTISTAMNFVGATSTSGLNPFLHTVLIVAIFAIMCLVTLVLFLTGNRIISYLGNGLVNVTSRIMGLIIAVISVQMVISGVINLVKLYQTI